MVQSSFYGNCFTSRRIINTPSEFARKNLLFLQEAGMLKASKPHENQRDCLNSYLFFIVLSGEGELEYQGRIRKLKQGDCAFLDCTKYYIHRTNEHYWSLQWVHFNGNNMANIYAQFLRTSGDYICSSLPKNIIKDTLLDIFTLAKSCNSTSEIEINERLSSLISTIFKYSVPKSGKILMEDNSFTLKIKEYIESHFTEKLNLNDIAKTFFMNKYYLERNFKKYYGETIINYINNMRITSAKERLRFSNASIKQIALETGFREQNYFCRIFKKIEKISPSEYKKEWKA